MEYFKTAFNGNDNGKMTEYQKTVKGQVDYFSYGLVKPIDPEYGEVNVSVRPLYQWEPIKILADDEIYLFQISSEPDFSTILYRGRTKNTSFQHPEFLNPFQKYYWRVKLDKEKVDVQESFMTSVSIFGPTSIVEGQTVQLFTQTDGVGDYLENFTWEVAPSSNATINSNGLLQHLSGQPLDDLIVTVQSVDFPSVSNTYVISVLAESLPDDLDDSLQGDRDSLQLIYDAAGGDNWHNIWDENVIQNGDLSTLFGVETNADGRVTEIDIMSNNLVGVLPEFPGLHKMWKFYVKQFEPMNMTAYDGPHQFEPPQPRLTGRLPDSLGHTSVTHLSVCGRRGNGNTTQDRVLRPDDATDDWTKKSGVAWNQFEGEVPDSWYQLHLQYFEIQGLNKQFNFQLKPNNWNIKRLFAGGNLWSRQPVLNDADRGPSSSGMIDHLQDWTECNLLSLSDNQWDGIASDAFDNWVNVPKRSISIGVDDFDWRNPLKYSFNQPLPDVEHLIPSLDSFSASNRGWTGPYPAYFHNSDRFASVSLNNAQWDSVSGPVNGFDRMTNLRTSYRASQHSSLQLNINADLFEAGVYVGGHTAENGVILFYFAAMGWTGDLPEGLHEWYQLREFVGSDNKLSSDLPSKPPAMYGPSLKWINLSNNELTGNMTEHWAFAGSREPYGGVMGSGAVTGSGLEDPEGNYVEDINANWTVNEFQPETATANGPMIKIGSNLRRVISNTSTRIYYSGSNVSTSLGTTFEVVRNRENDVRPFTRGIDLANNNLTGLILESYCPQHITRTNLGPIVKISGNRYKIKHIAPSIDYWESIAARDEWNYIYAPQQDFGSGIPQSVAQGDTLIIDFSDESYPGNEYTWFKNDQLIDGQNSDTLTISNFQLSDEGTYHLKIFNPKTPDLSGDDAYKSKPITVTLL